MTTESDKQMWHGVDDNSCNYACVYMYMYMHAPGKTIVVILKCNNC